MPDDAGVEYKVLQVNVRPGEFVGNAPNQALVVLGCVGKLHVRVDLDENDIARFDPKFTGVAKPRGNPDATYPLAFVRVEPYVVPKKALTGRTPSGLTRGCCRSSTPSTRRASNSTSASRWTCS